MVQLGVVEEKGMGHIICSVGGCRNCGEMRRSDSQAVLEQNPLKLSELQRKERGEAVRDYSHNDTVVDRESRES